MSAFALEDGVVYHTYSTYARGLDSLWGMYQWLNRAPKGRNGRNEPGLSVWWLRHDEVRQRSWQRTLSSRQRETSLRGRSVRIGARARLAWTLGRVLAAETPRQR